MNFIFSGLIILKEVMEYSILTEISNDLISFEIK